MLIQKVQYSVVPPGAAVALPFPPEIPGYQLLELLGEGGVGAVYRAVQLGAARPVAIKALGSHSRGGHKAHDLERESRLLASLNHANVVDIYEWGYVSGRPYLVMEYVPGRSLRRLLRNQAWPVASALSYVEQISRALSYIHLQGILHLDLKPENVLLQKRQPELSAGAAPATAAPESFVPKISDFGQSLRAVVDSELGASEFFGPLFAQGTLDYCSLELRYGLPIDVRTDLFALATLAYELLTGRLPGRVFRTAARYNPQLPTAVDDVLRQGLARDREERFPSVEKFRSELMTAAHSLAPLPKPREDDRPWPNEAPL